ncbi:serine hydrolase domain-containing protein [Tomitella fengzijianii]|uniref:Beta-lactamase family protein n=1 Tax=Tomitella fengzijianii TaxID=2597660 RepID=A0A516WZ46_9ACTN|nr:serine hydrolase domain-containing protein [Tomitella fengzijianii]QDQ96114.1 beta-lactamase family protein [Tomitella fengzijianii]
MLPAEATSSEATSTEATRTAATRCKRPWTMLARAVSVASLAAASATVSAAAAYAAEPPAVGPGAVAEEIADEAVSRQLESDRIPGAAVTVVADGRVVFSRGYGLADVDDARPVEAERTGFFPASVAKTFTATALGRLIGQGRLDPHADINEYLDDMQVPDTYPGTPVTAEHLLTHTGGFDNDVVGRASATGGGLQSLGRSVADAPPARVREPGSVVAYDNYGFALAGHLVEAITGKPFEQYVREAVLAPLGMDSTTLAQPRPTAVEASPATGYRPAGGGFEVARGQFGPWTPTGAGVVTTAADMGRFMVGQLGDDPALGPGVTARVQRQHFTQDDRVPGMAYAFAERSWDGRRVLVKDGDLPGFHSNLALVPEAGVGVFVTYNGDGVDGAAFWDAKELTRALIRGLVPPAPGEPEPGAEEPGAMGAGAVGNADRFAGTYRPSTVSSDSMMRFAGLTSAVQVRAERDGRIVTDGLSMDPAVGEQHWVQRSPGVFTEVGGPGRIAFADGVLAGAGPEATAYERLAWYEVPGPHLIAVGAAAVVLLLAAAGYPAVVAWERWRGARTQAGTSRRGRAQSGARLAAWLAGVLGVVFACQFAVLVADGNALSERVLLGSPLLTSLPWVGAALALPVAGTVVAAPAAWVRGWWAAPGRVAYTVVAAGGVVFVGIAAYYGLVGLPGFPG